MQGKITAIETGGRNDFGTNDAIILDPIGVTDGERCDVCGEEYPIEELHGPPMEGRGQPTTTCGRCREKLLNNCPNCNGIIDKTTPDYKILLAGGAREVCKMCYEGYTEL